MGRTKRGSWVALCTHPAPPPEGEGRLSDKGRMDCGQHSEGSGGDWDDGEPSGRSVARPAHCDKEPHMNGHHLYDFIAQNKRIFFPFGRQSSVRSVRARIKAQRIAMQGMSHQGASESPTGMLPKGQGYAGAAASGSRGSLLVRVLLQVRAIGQNGLLSDLLCRLFTRQ